MKNLDKWTILYNREILNFQINHKLINRILMIFVDILISYFLPKFHTSIYNNLLIAIINET